MEKNREDIFLLDEREVLDIEIRKVESKLEELLVELARLHVLDLLEGRAASLVQAGRDVLGGADTGHVSLTMKQCHYIFSNGSLVIAN